MKVAILYNLLDQSEAPLDEKGVLDTVNAVEEALTTLNIPHTIVPVGRSMQEWLKKLLAYKPDVVFNLCEAVAGESRFEMNIPSVLELLRIPYTGSPPLTLGICQNKALAKAILLSNGITTPKHFVITERLEFNEQTLSFPVIVKPVREDGSLGISSSNIVLNPSEVAQVAETLMNKYRQPALVEEYIDGQELNVAIIGENPPQPLPISEIVFPPHYRYKIVSYEAKWVEESDEYHDTKAVCPAQLAPDTASKVMAAAVKAYKILGCRDYARVDIRLRGDTPYVLEVNPNPDISPGLGLPRSLEVAGISYRDFVMRIVSSALQRGG